MQLRFEPPDKVTATASASAWVTALTWGAIFGSLLAIAIGRIFFGKEPGLVPMVCAALVIGCYALRATRLKVVAERDHLRVTNLYRTVRIPWSDVRSVGDVGISQLSIAPVIRRRSGMGVTIVALAEATPSRWRRRAWVEEAKRRIPDERVHEVLDQF